MDELRFGWIVEPTTKNSQDLDQLMKDNRAFLDALEGHFTSFWVEDHYQWKAQPTAECWTTMSYLAALYPTYDLGSIVLGQSYRNPASLAKSAAVLQSLSGGRLILGIGAGWKEDEYAAYGYPYPSAKIRIEQLAETAEIIRRMWTEIPASFEGKHYQIKDAYCVPLPKPLPPLLIAGGGEKLTLKVVAKYADWWNINICPISDYIRKRDILHGYMNEIKRDQEEMTLTYNAFLSVSHDPKRITHRKDIHVVGGSPEEVAAELRQFIAAGVKVFIFRFVDFPSTEGRDLFLSEVLPKLR